MDIAAQQLIRALRGHRSQVAFSRRLGYRGNVAAKWEGGHRFPTFGEVLRAAGRTGIDVPAALVRFHEPSATAWDPQAPDAIAQWLSSLQGRTPQALLAERSGLSRQQVGRLLSGRAKGRLPKVMALIDAMTGRLPDLIGELVPIEQVPALAREAQVRHALARLAFEHPWSPAVQSWLGTRRSVPADQATAQLAAELDLEHAHAEALISALVEAGVAQIVDQTLRPAPAASVEIRATAEDLQRIKSHWASVSADRVERHAEGDLFSFNVFAVSRDDLEQIQEAQRRFYREVRAIVAESPPEVVALLVVHTASLST